MQLAADHRSLPQQCRLAASTVQTRRHAACLYYVPNELTILHTTSSHSCNCFPSPPQLTPPPPSNPSSEPCFRPSWQQFAMHSLFAATHTERRTHACTPRQQPRTAASVLRPLDGLEVDALLHHLPQRAHLAQLGHMRHRLLNSTLHLSIGGETAQAIPARQGHAVRVSESATPQHAWRCMSSA
jgi:hypothetical protein